MRSTRRDSHIVDFGGGPDKPRLGALEVSGHEYRVRFWTLEEWDRLPTGLRPPTRRIFPLDDDGNAMGCYTIEHVPDPPACSAAWSTLAAPPAPADALTPPGRPLSPPPTPSAP
jgi:hypothetical protein